MRALRSGLAGRFGITATLDDIEFAGRTDRWIIRAILRKFSLPETEENFAALFEAYAERLPGELHNPEARVLPGVHAALAAFAARGDTAQGLLTGNLRRGAKAKLSHHGLWEAFAFGAFGDDGELRNDLGPHALRRAQETHRVHFPPERVWVIGDTAHDIACGRAIGARTLAVGTGGAPLDELRRHAPCVCLPDLTDTDALVALVCGRAG